ncbi:MAG: hypothetical protein JO189_23875 [Deltaproteobacteria bacterium]|nr:hypothetical protein [Deltaproteobacteria bacterium]
MQALLAKAINTVFAKRHKPEIAELTSSKRARQRETPVMLDGFTDAQIIGALITMLVASYAAFFGWLVAGTHRVLCTQRRQKPAIRRWKGGHLLCVDCDLKFTQARASRLNYVSGRIEARLGYPNLLPRLEIPQSIVHSGPMTFNNIKVDKSAVGVINTGFVNNLDAIVGQVREAGDPDLGNHLAR